MEGLGRRATRLKLQSRPQESKRQGGLHAFAAGATCCGHIRERKTYRGDHRANWYYARQANRMKHTWPTTPLGAVLTERREVPHGDDLLAGRVRIVEKISFDSGEIRLRTNGATKTGMILVRPGDLVVSGINAAKGAIAVYDLAEKQPVAATIH